MKHIFIGILLGNVVHFVGREAGSLAKAYRERECRHHKTSDACEDATMLEKVLLFELDLGSKVFSD